MPIFRRKGPKALPNTSQSDADQKPQKSVTRGVFISTINSLLRRNQTWSVPESDDARQWIATKYVTARAIEDRKRTRRQEEHVRAHLAYFEQSMDPLPARALYNHKFSRMYNLPHEILLQIMRHLEHDKVAFFMFRRASRLFRHLASHEEFYLEETNPFSLFCRLCRTYHDRPCWFLTRDLKLPDRHASSYARLRKREKALVRHLLEKDRLCDRCRVEKLHDRTSAKWASCKFWKPEWNWRQCGGCEIMHVTRHFSPTELHKDRETRICVGREGHVRVCDHLTLTWADVERGVSRLREMIRRRQEMIGPYKTMAFVCVELTRCRHESHFNDGCECIQHGPIVQLRRFSVRDFELRIIWQAHSGRGTFPLHRPGVRPGALTEREMRDMFVRHRQNGANYVVPSLYPGHLPEMVCFRPDECDCIDYQCGQSAAKSIFSAEHVAGHQKVGCETDAVVVHQSKAQDTMVGTRIQVGRCKARPAVPDNKSPCIVTTYHRSIFGEGRFGDSIVPPHAWSHMLDRASYEGRGREAEEGSCDNPDCQNFYETGVSRCLFGMRFDEYWAH